ncbi:MAG: ABC transporter ATP-binding protein [Bacillota bacterium]|nr:ABC transporter ATP-binding protein [Bacillota bacterium]
MTIEVKNLAFAYNNRKRVLEDINFVLKDGEFMSVLGCNGAGKSTLFSCILGILDDYQGQILIDGTSIREFSAKELAAHIAYIPQIHKPSFAYSVMNMVLMGLNRELSIFQMPRQEHIDRAYKALEQVGIEDLAYRNFAKLSGGEQQLTLIARAIAQNSKVFIMDEPTSALDYGNQFRIMKEIRKLADQGYSVLMSTHNPQHSISFADSVLALDKGYVAAYGKPSQVINEDLIRVLYKIDVRIEETANGNIINPYFAER